MADLQLAPVSRSVRIRAAANSEFHDSAPALQQLYSYTDGDEEDLTAFPRGQAFSLVLEQCNGPKTSKA